MPKKFLQNFSISALISLSLSSISVKAMDIIDGTADNKQRVVIPASPKVSREAILLHDLSSLSHTADKYRKKLTDPEADVYSCDKDTFQKLFPIHPTTTNGSDSFDKSIFVGQIVNSNKLTIGTGTGTTLNVKFVSGDVGFRITGITAMHNFVGSNTDSPYYVKYGKTFLPGKKYNPNDGSFQIWGKTKIDKVIVQKNPTKDICLFEGKLEIDNRLFPKDEDFINFYKTVLKEAPKILEDDALEKTGTMYHYPLGVEHQRKNEGSISENGQHQIRSLYGSSGASIFVKKGEEFKIAGIHRGGHLDTVKKDAVVKYEGRNGLPVMEFNVFEIISNKDYADLIDGVNLYEPHTYILNDHFTGPLSIFAENNFTE
jgi:hypothetical protein